MEKDFIIRKTTLDIQIMHTKDLDESFPNLYCFADFYAFVFARRLQYK